MAAYPASANVREEDRYMNSDPTVPAPHFSLAPLMFQNFSCTLAIMAFVALVGPVASTLSLAAWHIGVAMTLGGFTWVFCARWWGAMGDRLGRRRVMLRGLTGFIVSYFLLCVFIDKALDWLLAPLLAFLGIALGRVIIGVFYAAVPASAAAMVADNIPASQRAGAMAMLGAATGAGMVVGPGFVGLLAPYGLGLPMYATALLPLLALLVVWQRLPDQPPQASRAMPSPSLRDPRLRAPIVVAFAAAFSVSISQVVVGFFALDVLRLEASAAAQTAGIALTVVGVVLVLSQTLMRRLSWAPVTLIQRGAIIAAIGFAGTAWVNTEWGLWACFAVAAAGMGWVYPSVSALAANAVEAGEQGVVAGTVSAAQGAGVIVGPLVGTLVYAVNAVLPYTLVAALLAVIAVVIKRLARI